MVLQEKGITELLRQQMKIMVTKWQNSQPTRRTKINSSMNSTSSQQQRGEQQTRLIPTISGHTDVDRIQNPDGKMVSQTDFPMIDNGIDQ